MTLSRVAIAALLCMTASSVSPAQEAQKQDHASGGPSVGFPDSEAGLQAQLKRIIDPMTEAESNQFDALIDQLKVPDDSDWFTRIFGLATGAKVAARYRDTWPEYRAYLASHFEWQTRETGLRIQARELTNPSAQSLNWLASKAISSMMTPARIYEASIILPTGMQGTIPGLYIYDEGAFRVLDWQCLYELPNTRPSRIRVGANVAQSQLVYQVPPHYPPEARAKHVTGTAILHAIIGLDGSVHHLEVANPDKVAPALAAAAMQAVQQWRYKPTLLNGDPAEVDTTVAVTFTLGPR